MSTLKASEAHAIVIGGSVVGIMCAAALANHFARVTVLDRDTFPAEPGMRKGIPQGRHAHGLLARGYTIVRTLLPGIEEQQHRRGIAVADCAADIKIHTGHGWLPTFSSGIKTIVCSRDLLEWTLRQETKKRPNVTFRERQAIAGFVVDARHQRLVGVKVVDQEDPGAGTTVLEGDLIIDASGRHSKLAEWLAEAGYSPPEAIVRDPQVTYASRWFTISDAWPAESLGIILRSGPQSIRRAGAAFMVEGGRFVVSLVGSGGESPGSSQAEFLDFARSLSTPVLYQLIQASEPCSRIFGYRGAVNSYTNFSAIFAQLHNLLVIGDAFCALNPTYAQGITLGALYAEQINSYCARHQDTDIFAGLNLALNRQMLRQIRLPWFITNYEDNRHNQRNFLLTTLFDRYIDRIYQRAEHDPAVCKDLIAVINMIQPPHQIIMPKILRRLLT